MTASSTYSSSAQTRGLGWVYAFKMAVTLVFWVAPFLLAPELLCDLANFTPGPGVLLFRLLGWAYLALVVGYFYGWKGAKEGLVHPGPLYMGLFSNGGAALMLMVALFGGVSNSNPKWGDLGRPEADLLALGQLISLLATSTVTFGLILEGLIKPRRRRLGHASPFRDLIESEAIVQAPIETVWQVLTDLNGYAEWNAFTPKVETDFRIGSEVVLHVRLREGKPLHVQKERLLAFAEGESMAWGIDKAFPVRTIRVQKLEALDGQRTRYYTSDAFQGLLTPLVMALYRESMQRGFDEVAQGLKGHCEGLLQAHPNNAVKPQLEKPR